MLDIELLYVKYRQQELWQEAANRALAAQVQPKRPRWWTRGFDTLITFFAAWLQRASRRFATCPAPAVACVAQSKPEGKNTW